MGIRQEKQESVPVSPAFTPKAMCSCYTYRNVLTMSCNTFCILYSYMAEAQFFWSLRFTDKINMA